MNKYVSIAIAVVLILAGGMVYKKYFQKKVDAPLTTGVVREFIITSEKNKWNFVPENIEVNRGDKVVITVVNKDDYDHGIAIDAFGISQRMPANSSIKFEFVATQAGEFAYYCSVPCGEGVVDGAKRTHFSMQGKIFVKG
jgi:plastocyanin